MSTPATAVVAAGTGRGASAAQRFWAAVRAQPVSLAGAAVLLAAAVLAVGAPYLPLPAPDQFAADSYRPPSPAHPMGTDNLGRDVMVRTIWGTRLGMTVAVVSAGISTGLGILFGSVPAYYGGWWDEVFSRVFDVFLLIPAFFLVIVIVSLFGTSAVFVMLVIGVTTFPRSARIMRSQVLALRPRAFVQAARAAGAGPLQTLFRHIVPNGLPPVITNATLLMGTAVLTEAGLSFLGLGDAATTSWGRMIFEGQRQLRLAPWMSVFPGLAMLVVVWAFNMVGDALNRFLSPQVREGAGPAAAIVAAAGREDGEDTGGGIAGDAVPHPPVPAVSSVIASSNGDGAQAPRPALLDVRDLTMYYRLAHATVRAVDGVSFAVRPGECYGLVGESGCGKTSIAYSLLRLLPANGRLIRGAVYFEGTEILGFTEEEFRRVRWCKIAMVFQGAMNALNPVRRIGDQLTAAYRLHRPEAPMREARDRAEAMFDLVGINSDRLSSYPHELSGGMRQRAVIALSLLLDPSLLIADEPVTALDVLVQDQILDALDDLRRRLGIAMILVSHDLGVMAETCDRIGVVYAGQIVEEADTGTIYDSPRHPYTRSLMLSVPLIEGPRRRLMSLPGVPFDLRQATVGCRFADRCPIVQDICRRETPPLVPVRPGHVSRCHFALDAEAMRFEAAAHM